MAHYRFFLVCFPFAISFAEATSSLKCLKESFPTKFKKEICHPASMANPWFVHSSSERCDGCCMSHRMEMDGDTSFLFAVDKLKRPNDTTANVVRVAVRKHPTAPHYYIGNDPLPLKVLYTDCKDIAVTYELGKKRLQVMSWRLELDPKMLDSLDSVAKCNMKMYKYKPSSDCS